MKKRPIIALTPDVDEKSNGRLRAYVNREYTDAVIAAGGLPVVLPLTDDEAALEALLARVDGLVLTGGGDVDPAFYGGDAADARVQGVSRVRDRMEIFLLWRLLAEKRRPVLGICRGIQVMNVAAGGTLVVDVPSEVGTAVDHHDKRQFEPVHDVAIEPGSRLAALAGAARIGVNSSHHQAVKDVGRDFRPVASCPDDGVIEAIELSDRPFFIGVQWHPERLQDKLEHAAALFRALVEAAVNKK